MKEEHYEDEDIFDFIFLMLLGGFLFARIWHTLLYGLQNQGSWLTGFVDLRSFYFFWLSFLLGILYVARIVAKRKKNSIYVLLDFSVYGLVVAQIWLKLGQWLHGSDLGLETALPWGLPVPGLDNRYQPVALYEVIGLLLAWWFLSWLERHYRFFDWYRDHRGEAKSGLIWFSYLGLSSLISFSLNWFREYSNSIQFVLEQGGLILGLLGSLVLIWMRSGHSIAFTPRSKKELPVIRQPLHSAQPSRRLSRFKRSKEKEDERL